MRHSCGKDIVLPHYGFHGGNRFILIPRAGNAVFKHLVQAVILVPNVFKEGVCEFCIVNIPDNNVQIRVLRMVQIVYIPAFYQLEFLPELRYIARL